MTKKVILTYGVFGVGKTYFGEAWIKEHPEYKLLDTDRNIDTAVNNISKHDYVICDYYFHLDPGLEKLKALGCEVELIILFDKPENITFKQVIYKGIRKSDIGVHVNYRVYACTFPHELNIDNYKYYDCGTKKYCSYPEFAMLFTEYCEPYTKQEIEWFIKWVKECKGHDHTYQWIDLPHGLHFGKGGYANNKETWDAMKDLIDWKGKTVLDIGCFHGYFSREIVKAGGMPLALDKSARVVYVAAVLNKILDVHCPVAVYDVDTEFPTGYFYNLAPPSTLLGVEAKPLIFIYNEDKKEFDVGLCLSMFHHVKNQDFFLKNLQNCKQVLFKINKKDKAKVLNYFSIIKEKEAPGERIFLLCEVKKLT